MNVIPVTSTTQYKFRINEDVLELNFQLQDTDIVKVEKNNKQKGYRNILDILEALIEKTDLKHIKIFVTPKLYYIYSKKEGYYLNFSKDDLKLLLKNLLEFNVHKRIPLKLIETLLKELCFHSKLSPAGTPTVSKTHLVFKNGVLNLETREFTKFTPKVFSISKLMYEYDELIKKCPNFHNFIKGCCDGNQNRIKFIQVMFNSLIRSKTQLQLFFYVYGPGASRKSTLVNMLVYMLGEKSVHTRILKDLNQDSFEVVNLIGKKLIIINDTEDYIQNMDIIKAFIWNDSIRRKRMYTQETLEVRSEGIILAVRNHPLKEFLIPCGREE